MAHPSFIVLTLWSQVTHTFVSNVTIIDSDNGLSPGRRQAIIWTNAGILLIGPLGTHFNEILIEIHTFLLKKMHLKMSAKWQPCCLGLIVSQFSTDQYNHLAGFVRLSYLIIKHTRAPYTRYSNTNTIQSEKNKHGIFKTYNPFI